MRACFEEAWLSAAPQSILTTLKISEAFRLFYFVAFFRACFIPARSPHTIDFL
jgi:triacylglycerol esterase/lipase EstA (alpha/beta hydrolase family)